MSERVYPDPPPREFDLENPLPGLDTMLRDAADDATRLAFVPPYEVIQVHARRRRTAWASMAGAFGVVVVLAMGLAAVTVAGRDRDGDRPRPAASPTLDQLFRQYWTEIPILTWTPAAGRTASAVARTDEFRAAVFSGLDPGDYEYSDLDDLRALFPDAPVGGPAVAIEQSVTAAEVERAAANLRQLDGVRDTRVVVVSGLWFTVWATSSPTSEPRMPPSFYVDGIGLRGTAGGQRRDEQGLWINWVRATYLGPAMNRADFDRLRTAAAEAVDIDVSQVVVVGESSAPDRSPTPT